MTYQTAAEAWDACTVPAGEYIPFEGQNCDEVGDGRECAGWDGVSRRCECGNRRVYWDVVEVNDHTFYPIAVAD